MQPIRKNTSSHRLQGQVLSRLEDEKEVERADTKLRDAVKLEANVNHYIRDVVYQRKTDVIMFQPDGQACKAPLCHRVDNAER